MQTICKASFARLAKAAAVRPTFAVGVRWQSSEQVRDGLDLIQHDHGRLRSLISEYQSAHSQEDKVRIAKSLVRETSIHSSIEERYLYPLIETKLHNPTAHDHSTTAHQVVKEHLDFIDRHTPRGDEDWKMFDTSVKMVSEELMGHMEEEESMILPKLRGVMQLKEAEQLGMDLEQGRQTAPIHPHPEGPTRSATAARMMHPMAAAADKMTDST